MSWFSSAVKQAQKETDAAIKNIQKQADAALGQATGGALGTTLSMQSAAGKSSVPSFNMPEIQNITPNWDQLQPNLNQDLTKLNPEKLQSAAVNLGTDIQREAVNIGSAAQTAATDAGSAVQAATTEALSKVPTPAAQVAAAVTNAGFVPTPAGVGLKVAQEATGYTVPTPAGVFAEEAIKWGAAPTPAGIAAKALGTVPTPAGIAAKALGTVPTPAGVVLDKVKEETGYYLPSQWILDQFMNPPSFLIETEGGTKGGTKGGTQAQPLPEAPTFNDNQPFQDIETATTKGDQMTEEERLRRIRRLMLNRYGREDTILTGTADPTRRRRTAPGFMGM